MIHNPSSESSNYSNQTGNMSMSAQTKISATEVAAAWFNHYRTQDVDGMVTMFTPDAIIEYVPLDLSANPEQLAINGWSVLIDAFPDLTNEVQRIWQDSDENTAFVDVYIGGTQRKDAFGIPNQGQKYWLRHLFILEVNDIGKIIKMIAFWDSVTWYQQLGKMQLP
jgi:steroid delta-isomerase-like uncharacterized protein